MSKERVFTLADAKIKRKSLRNNSTAAECTLWKVLKNRQIEGLRFRRQHSIGPYIMDFYCPEIKLCIELDGEPHDNSEQYNADMERTKYINEEGITVLRFSNNVVFKNIEVVTESIKWFRENPQQIKGYVKDMYLGDITIHHQHSHIDYNPPLTPPCQGGEMY